MRTMNAILSTLVMALLACLAAPPAWAQAPLALGKLESAKTTADAPAEYVLKAASAGVLTVAVLGEGDLVIEVLDAGGEQVPDGMSDRDINGNTGRELLAVTLTAPGDYRVRVRVQFGEETSTFQIAASWLPFPPFAAPEDADGQPSLARAITVGESISGSLDSAAGDLRDWYVVSAAQSGTLVVVTRPEGEDGPDLVLEAFLDGVFDNATARSDQDLQGNATSESVSVNVRAGQTVHIKVSGAFSSAQGAYRLSSSLMP